LTFRGLLYQPPFTDESQIWRARADPRSSMQISSECVYCVGFRWPKTNHNFWKILIFEGSCPFTVDGQIWCARVDPWSTLTCRILSRSVYSFALWQCEPPNFAVFGLRHTQTDTQTRVTTIHFASSTTHAKYNNVSLTRRCGLELIGNVHRVADDTITQ